MAWCRRPCRPRRGRGDRVLGDEGLARAGGRGDEHRGAGVERVERPQLEAIERERTGGLEVGAQPLRGHGAEVVGEPFVVGVAFVVAVTCVVGVGVVVGVSFTFSGFGNEM